MHRLSVVKDWLLKALAIGHTKVHGLLSFFSLVPMRLTIVAVVLVLLQVVMGAVGKTLFEFAARAALEGVAIRGRRSYR